MTEEEEQILEQAGKRTGNWTQRRWLSIDKLLSLAIEGYRDAYFELSLRYELGIEVKVDREKAIYYLKKSATEQCGAALMRLVNEYRDGGSLFDKDPVEWMRRLHEAADSGIFAAFEQLAEIKLAGRRARDCSVEELREIEDLYARAEKFYKAGSMYCTDKESPECSDEEVSKAREWYHKGVSPIKSANCDKCAAILKSWGELSSPTQPVEESISLMELLITPFALVLWSGIGTALLGVVLSINAVTIPLLIGGSVVVALYRVFKR